MIREKVEYKTWTSISKYHKDKEDRLMSGWNIVDSALMEKQQSFLTSWLFYIQGWIIYEKPQ